MSYKIALVGLLYDDNLGDPLMVECVERIYKNIAKNKSVDVTFKHVDLYGKKSEDQIFKRSKIQNITTIPYRMAKKITKKHLEKMYLFFERKLYEIDKSQEQKVKNYYYENLNDCDMVVIVGGALIKFRYNRDFYNPLSTLVKVAEDLKVDVVFNSVGIENGYNESFATCKIVKSFLNSKSVKLITTRDDFETLKKYVDNEETYIGKTADSATWYKELFDIKESKNKKVLGISVISPEKFDQYTDDNKSEQYVELITSFIKLLLEKNVKFQLFTNGHFMDQRFLESLAAELQLDSSYITKRPEKYSEIVENMLSYHTIIASRLHSCILGYSLDLPVLGIDWNNKLLFFGQEIKQPERFFKPDEVSPLDLYDKVMEIKHEKYEPIIRGNYRDTQIKSIERTFEILSRRKNEVDYYLK